MGYGGAALLNDPLAGQLSSRLGFRYAHELTPLQK